MGRRRNVPTTYELKLPRDISSPARRRSPTKYKATRASTSARTTSTPARCGTTTARRPSGCTLDGGRRREDDRRRCRRAATTRPASTPSTTRSGKTTASRSSRSSASTKTARRRGDAGIDGFNEFVGAMKRELGARNAHDDPGERRRRARASRRRTSTFDATLADGKKVKVTALLVDNDQRRPARRRSTRATRRSRRRADLIAYNGHAGLGRTSARSRSRASGSPASTVVVFMNGCDTFAYVDGSLAQTRAALNPDDPTGTKYMDIVTNAMPSFFRSMPSASMALITGLMNLRRARRPTSRSSRSSTARRSCSSPARRTTCSRPAAAATPARPWAGLDAASARVHEGETKKRSDADARRRARTRSRSPAPATPTSTSRVGTRADRPRVRLPPVQERLERDLHGRRSPRRRTIHVMVRGYAADVDVRPRRQEELMPRLPLPYLTARPQGFVTGVVRRDNGDVQAVAGVGVRCLHDDGDRATRTEVRTR